MSAPARFLLDAGLDRLDVGGTHLADRCDLAVDDLPQAERARDIAELVKVHRADDALVANGLALGDQLQRLGKFLLARMDRLTRRIDRLSQGIGLCLNLCGALS